MTAPVFAYLYSAEFHENIKQLILCWERPLVKSNSDIFEGSGNESDMKTPQNRNAFTIMWVKNYSEGYIILNVFSQVLNERLKTALPES
jgi:hypothetical protein